MHISLSKLNRAKHEIDQLDAIIAEEVRRPENRATLRARYNRESKCHEIYISETPDLANFKTNVSIPVGVIVHLLRSSLENLVFYLAQRHTENNIQNPRNISFPISDAADSYDQSSRRCLAELSKRDRETIYAYQPFHGIAGRPDSYSGPYIHQLSLLRDISNSDKHRELVEVSVDPNHFEFTREASEILEAWSAWVQDNPQEYFQSYEPPLMRIGEIVQQPVETKESLGDDFFAGYALAHVAMAERRPVVPTLSRIVEYVKLLLGEFEGLRS